MLHVVPVALWLAPPILAQPRALGRYGKPLQLYLHECCTFVQCMRCLDMPKVHLRDTEHPAHYYTVVSLLLPQADHAMHSRYPF